MDKPQLQQLHEQVRTSISVRQDGSTSPVSLDSDPVTNLQSERLAQIATCSDASLATAIEQVTEGIMVTDNDGTILYVNPAFESITGYSSRQAEGQSWTLITNQQQNDTDSREMWFKLERGEIWKGRITGRKQDGSHFETDTTISPVADPSGVITSFVFVTRDITHEITLDEQLRQSQKMEAIGQLAGGVAHDFNNLLVAIQGHATFALENLSPDSAAHNDLMEVQRAAERAAALTGQLLAFSRRQMVQPVDLDLNDVIRNLMKMLKRLISEDIDLVFTPGAELDNLRANRGHIEQILVNLCVNARDAMPGGGQITLKTENFDLDEEFCSSHSWARGGRFLRLSVTDTGSGMDQETLIHAFEPFFTTKDVGEGTGLGLPTVRGIVEQHQGLIHVDSQPGVGTTFEIYLPSSAKRPLKTEAAATEKVRGGHETVLLAEDDEVVRLVSVRALEANGYKVLTATNGQEAVRLFQKHAEQIDLVLLDMVMPTMGGLEARQLMLAIKPETQVLFASGYDSGDSVLRSNLEPDIPLISKPYRPDELLLKVRAVLDEVTD